MAGKAINVKVPRIKILEALENRLAEMTYQKENYDEAVAKYERDKADWVFKVSELALTSDKVELDTKGTQVYTDHWRVKSNGYAKVEISLDIPKEMLPAQPEEVENPFGSRGYGRNYIGDFNDRKEEMENAIRILRLSDEEVVSTSTYQSVSRYL